MNSKSTPKLHFLFLITLALILIIGGYFRFTGIRWDQDYHLHPDERFLTMVTASIQPVENLNEYFDTAHSSLNPHNVLDGNGNSIYPFFVYGTLPLFTVRYIGEWLGQTGYGQIHIVGRYLSGIFDLGTVLIIFLLGIRLFPGNKWPALCASFLYACAVLPIQISHFFIVDHFTTFFATLAVYACLRISQHPIKSNFHSEYENKRKKLFANWERFGDYVLFAVALGMAAASKINAIVIALLLPVAVIIKSSLQKGKFHFSFNDSGLRNMVLAGVISFIVFRFFQPYAFNGPGFFHISPNPRWINNLTELSALSSGESNYPPSLQWARRGLFFPLTNMIVWGLGLPLGLFGLAGLILMGVRVFKGDWGRFGVIWLFTTLYLLWQVTLWNPTMRYFLLIYPFLAIMAAWFTEQSINALKSYWYHSKPGGYYFIAGLLGLTLMGGTLLWATAFLNIYRQPMTRIAASRWIYENVESAVNLKIRSDDGEYLQPLPYSHDSDLLPGEVLEIEFIAETAGVMREIRFDHVVQRYASDQVQFLYIDLIDPHSREIIASHSIQDTFQPDGDSRGRSYSVILDEQESVEAGDRLLLYLTGGEDAAGFRIFGSIDIAIETPDYVLPQSVFMASGRISPDEPFIRSFMPIKDGMVEEIEFFRVAFADGSAPNPRISVQISDTQNGEIIAEQSSTLRFQNENDQRGQSAIVELPRPVEVQANHLYAVSVSVESQDAILEINGSKTAKETDWDDALPLFMHGLNPFDTYEGVYPSDLNFQMYWDDNQEKLESFLRILYQADYIYITSNRQWGSTTQIPERYPLTTWFYKELIGCPLDDIQQCYRDARPGMFDGKLGFDLVQVFQSNPKILGLEFNSQYAEEAFTVYDHPKVLIFRKNAEFDIQDVAQRLGRINLDHVINLTPKEAEKRPGNLMLSESQMAAQTNAGTWSEIFNTDALINRSPAVTVLAWYLFISMLGWLVMPLVRIAFSGLADKGYGLSKPVGLLLLSLIGWLGGSLGAEVSRPLVAFSILGLLGINGFLFYRDRSNIIGEFHRLKQHFIRVELISLILFSLFLAVRIGNADLWHPYKGGEKPMDFSYLNAVIKSLHFPPYDPWFAGGYINYYYFGFVLAATPIKFLGVVPSVGYNLVMASFFCFTGLAAFSLLWNVSEKRRKGGEPHRWMENSYFTGGLGLLFVLIIGNLGTLRMIVHGFQRIAEVNSSLIQGSNHGALALVFNGLKLYLQGFNFPYYPGDWYWIPSRAIPGEPITEFPYFTFLYGDPHAHLFAYPYTLIALGWVLSTIFSDIDPAEKIPYLLQYLIGAAVIGSLRATNTWDFPIYLVLALGAVMLTEMRAGRRDIHKPQSLKIISRALIISALFFLTTVILFYPFIQRFGQGYSSIKIWDGDKTPLGSYLVHWGFFLFITGSYLAVRLYKWISITPVSALKPLYQYRKTLAVLLLLSISAAIYLAYLNMQIIYVLFPLALLCLVHMLLIEKTWISQMPLVLIAVALALTGFVEIAVLEGDIGRMNTVFKFYLQAWTFMAIASAMVLPTLLKDMADLFARRGQRVWNAWFAVLLFSVCLFPVLATADKVSDRISRAAPRTMDGMQYMQYAAYIENEKVMDLGQDYQAIRWMQESVSGTPVIIEAHVPEYRWGNRFTIYTGLPGVVGWNWHQRQQRAINPSGMVFDRVADVNDFFSTTDERIAMKIIDQYNIEYIIVGQLERATYPAEGLEKFEIYDHIYWEQVYSDRDTYIYRVNKDRA